MMLTVTQGSTALSVTLRPGRGPIGIGVASAEIGQDGHLILTLTNGTTADAGLAASAPAVGSLDFSNPLNSGLIALL